MEIIREFARYPRYPNGGYTGITYWIIVGQDVKGPHAFIGKAICSPKDTFSKRIGRMIARGRALKAVENYIKPDKPGVTVVTISIHSQSYRLVTGWIHEKSWPRILNKARYLCLKGY
jgi:hypothetical protein